MPYSGFYTLLIFLPTIYHPKWVYSEIAFIFIALYCHISSAYSLCVLIFIPRCHNSMFNFHSINICRQKHHAPWKRNLVPNSICSASTAKQCLGYDPLGEISWRGCRLAIWRRHCSHPNVWHGHVERSVGCLKLKKKLRSLPWSP